MELRRAAGLTQREVSIALDVTESTVRRWEKRGSIPHLPLDKVKLLTELYQCTLDDLVMAFSGSPGSDGGDSAINSSDDEFPLAS
jgi:transcriptional regulator with XRE-family HTH domain